ncbi:MULTISPECIES: ATP-grasp domain-containing protein [unclassified Rhizobium]|uniref:ATP-grasp domain-containing protein n=1 Tax=unclassified Rhizobium TaxID=2613769 RepID=UPI00071294FC|nr:MULTISPECIES: ATP-grasp domain-containing protein [unclassified Rhizobium]KQT02699.1 carboxylate--amine ligase [Rhizobium sp. Leaf391]KQU03418.1 carboxylate--amine ligase [Rhizobium sp. Leaf453]
MNFIFFSPHFPAYNAEFCYHLSLNGVRVLGIGDTPYDALSEKLRASLTEYYRVGDMEDDDEVIRAVGYFIHQYGKIDRFESLNEHWLELEARIRTDFNIYGTKLDFIDNLKQKSRMKDYFNRSGVATVAHLKSSDKASAQAFIDQVGYPIVVKPDLGSGASMTYKISTAREFDSFFSNKPSDISFILEEYVDGIILTYDGLIDRYGNVEFATSHRFEQSIMEVVNTDSHLYYFCLPSIDPEVEEAGRNILKAMDIRERFFHIELFKRKRDGKIIALEVNMRPPGAWMTDAINYTHDMDVYREWAGMVALNRVGGPFPGKYFTGYASRKHRLDYKYTHHEIVGRWHEKLVKYQEVETVFRRAMGDFAYQFRSEDLDEVREIVAFIQETKV